MMLIQPSTLRFIRLHEGAKRKAYKDVAGLDTIGVGHLIKPTENYLLHKELNDDEVNALLAADLEKANASIKKLVTATLTQQQYDALISFVFNVGSGAFARSTLLKKINTSCPPVEIKAEFMKWTRAGGKKVQGLVNRRTAEAELFCKTTGDEQ